MSSPTPITLPALALSLGVTTGTAYDGGSGATAASAAAAAQATASAALPATQTANPYTVASRALIAADINALGTDTYATAVTVTLPKDSSATIPVGSSGDVVQLGAGQVSFVAESGATVQPATTLNIADRYGRVKWEKIAANAYLLSGSLSA
jgi:hypothetical protein